METIEIRSSPWTTWLLLVGGIFLTAVSAALAFRLLPNMTADTRPVIAGYAGLVFFGGCTVLIARSLATATRDPVVTISPEGIRDTRVASELIRWRDVKAINTWRYQHQMVMVLAVDPEVERTLGLTRTARWTRKANKALGADGLCVRPQGIKINEKTLLSTSVNYWQAANGIVA